MLGPNGPLLPVLTNAWAKRRHLGFSSIVMTQYPHQLDRKVLGYADILVSGRLPSEDDVKAMVRANAAFRGMKAQDMMNLPDHKLILFADKVMLRGGLSARDIYKLLLLQARPQLAQHGGDTVRMVQNPRV